MPKQGRRPSRDRIVDAALELAERDGWESVRLHQVAAACNASLDAIRAHFDEKDAIIDAWFDRADTAMLRHYDNGALDGLPPRERVRQLIVVWLQSLAAHQRVTREMILHKLEPGHLHVQIPALLRISRTVQWIREGAMLDAPLPRRTFEETALTALFVNAFVYWLNDHSLDFRDTRRWLDRGLYVLETFGRWVPGGRFGGEGPDTAGADDTSGDPDADAGPGDAPAANEERS